jgi:hypothetical protein
MLASEGTNNDLFVKKINLLHTYYTDGVAHLLTRSRFGNYYLVVSVFNNFVRIEPTPDRTGPSLLKAHEVTLEFFMQRKSLVLIYSTEAYHPNYPARSYNNKRRTIVRL